MNNLKGWIELAKVKFVPGTHTVLGTITQLVRYNDSDLLLGKDENKKYGRAYIGALASVPGVMIRQRNSRGFSWSFIPIHLVECVETLGDVVVETQPQMKKKSDNNSIG